MTKRVWILVDPAKLLPPGKINMNIDSEILDELVQAGLGNDPASVVANALRFSRLLLRFKDRNGNVYVLNKQKHDDLDSDMVVVHAFEATR